MKSANTLIKISPELKKFLDSMKLNDNDSYNDVLWNFFEPYMERSKESVERSRISAQEYAKGKVKTVEEVFNINEFDKEILGSYS
ncbi:MAG: hypothetical protein AABY16_01710 [Nanoarchaeota archaeon]